MKAYRRFHKAKDNIFTEQGINSNNHVAQQIPVYFFPVLVESFEHVLEHSEFSNRKIKEFNFMGDGCNANGFCVIDAP